MDIEITLDVLLASRDARHALQLELLQANRTLTLLCLTVVMPGKIKRNSQSMIVADAALAALKEHFGGSISHLEVRDLNTGYEAYLLTPLNLLDAKRIACMIEETHPLGRLFDIDVINHDGVPVSRSAIGMPARKCMICGKDARFCMRNHSHTQEELHQHINEMIDKYVHEH